MKPAFNRQYLCNYFFALGLLLLLANDHLFKPHFHNAITGKLSDVAGLFIVPLFLRFLFPLPPAILCWATALAFVFWKSPLADGFIAAWNDLAPFTIQRIQDPTDLIALLILPFSYRLMQRIHKNEFSLQLRINVQPLWLLIPASFAFMATSYFRLPMPDGDVYIGKSFKLRMSKAAALDSLASLGYVVKADTSIGHLKDYYLIENVVLATDTIRSIQIRLDGDSSKSESRLYVDHVNLRGKVKLSDWRMMKRYAKRYEKLIDKNLIVELK